MRVANLKQPNYENIKVRDLEVGMYVIIPLSWHEHPFVKNHFLIKSNHDIEKIKELGLNEIQLDASRSITVSTQSEPLKPIQTEEEKASQKKQQQVTENLITTIQDQRLPPTEKATIVRQHSFSMMKNLLENPTAENIRESKKGISSIVSLILNDNDTLHYLMDITSHDYYTYTHSVDVGILSVALAKSLFKDSRDHDLYALGAGFFLHDLGKVNINKDIINKPGKLTDDEMRDMRRHPALGYKLLYETNQLTAESKTIVLQHHERADGGGYPKGLRGNEIHIYGRICAIADVYDALTTNRPYRNKMKPFDALKLMHSEMLHHFQKELFERFVLLFKGS
jgi:HD-GYP domain-containing protein (c-di-GMP phosphodiesterase class II)